MRISIYDPRDCSLAMARYHEDALEDLMFDRLSVDPENGNRVTPDTYRAPNDPEVTGCSLTDLCPANLPVSNDEAEEFLNPFAPTVCSGHVMRSGRPTGWSRAPLLAHTLTWADVETALEGGDSQQPADGQPTPQLTPARSVQEADRDSV